MIDKLKSFLKKIESNQEKIINDLRLNHSQSKEIEWGLIYHDSIRGKAWLEELPLNVGRWAGNYSFFYILNRILNDFQPKNILEHGLGESTKMISAYLDNYLLESNHTVVEQSIDWINAFNKRFNLSERTKIIECKLITKQIKNHIVNSYKNYESKINTKFDLYVIDGPFGSNRFSRYDIIFLIEKVEVNDEFIIIFDDANREGEIDTYSEILTILNNKGIKTYSEIYSGNKSSIVISTEKYKFATSL